MHSCLRQLPRRNSRGTNNSRRNRKYKIGEGSWIRTNNSDFKRIVLCHLSYTLTPPKHNHLYMHLQHKHLKPLSPLCQTFFSLRSFRSLSDSKFIPYIFPQFFKLQIFSNNIKMKCVLPPMDGFYAFIN